jgi:hypothetical protein
MIDGTRSDAEISEARDELAERLWRVRHVMLAEPAEGRDEDALLRAKYGDSLEGVDAPFPDPYELGMMSGKLSALRWALGDEWDNLDT